MAKTVNERRTETVRQTLSGRIGHYPIGSNIVRLEVFENSNCKSNIVQWDQTLSAERSLKNAIFSQNSSLSFQTWLLSNRPPNRMKLGHNGQLNTRNKFPKVGFSQSNDFSSNFGWTQKSRFWGNEEKSIKSKELEQCIHFKVGGRWWSLS
jgi:hypothetical protein